MRSETMHASKGLRSTGLRILAIVACVLVLAGCTSVKGWFGGNSEKSLAKKASEPAAVKAEVARPSTAATPGIKSALNPTGAWPFPTGSRPK